MSDETAEMKGQLLGLTILIGTLLKAFIGKGTLTRDEVHAVCWGADERLSFVCQNLQGSMPDDDLKRMESQAISLVSKLAEDLAAI